MPLCYGVWFVVALTTLSLLVRGQSSLSTSTEVVFSNQNIVFGRSCHDPRRLLPNTLLVQGHSSLPLAFQAFVQRPNSLIYEHDITPGSYVVRIGLLEQTDAVCNGSAIRRFVIAANGVRTSVVNVKMEVGCRVPHVVVLRNVLVSHDTKLVISLTQTPDSDYPPMLSNFHAFRMNSLPTPIGGSLSSARTGTVGIVLHWGFVPEGWVRFDPAHISPLVEFSSTSAAKVPLAYRSYATRNGNFSYSHPVPPGRYLVTLGWAETHPMACHPSRRVFSVDVNGKKHSKVDVYSAGGCNIVYTLNFDDIIINHRDRNAIVIQLFGKSVFPPFLSTLHVTPLAGSVMTDMSSNVFNLAIPASISQLTAGKVVASINAGISLEESSLLQGVSSVFLKQSVIEGTTDDIKFSIHRFGDDFSYVFDVPNTGLYSVNLFFAESYLQACKRGFRVFDVLAYDADSSSSTAVKITGIDVFEKVGCRTTYKLSLEKISVASSKLKIQFKSSQNYAMVSAIEVVSPINPLPAPSSDLIRINVGSSDDIPVLNTYKLNTGKFVLGTTHGQAVVYRTARVGTDFQYSFNLQPGAYEVILGFVEFKDKFCTSPGKRVFNVFVNDELSFEGLDVFKEAGCRKGIEKSVEQTVSTIDTKPLTIRFKAIVRNAVVSFLLIRPSKLKCTPSFDGELKSDHAAHAVPGSYPPRVNDNSPKSYVDADGDGSVTVFIDGSGSHTHFFDPSTNRLGQIIDYTWTNMETGALISKQVSFRYPFPLRTTRLKLTVVDDSCTTDEAETTVTVTGSVQSGMYCYFYESASSVPTGGTLLENPRPSYASVSKSASIKFPKGSFLQHRYAMRCQFFLEVTKDSEDSEIRLSTFGTGDAQLYKGEDLVIDTTASSTSVTSLSKGLTAFEITFLRKSSGQVPLLRLLLNGRPVPSSKLFHDRRTVVPIITSISPSQGQTSGGSTVKFSGYGLFQPLRVSFGDVQSKILNNGATSQQFFVESPSVDSEGEVDVVVKTGSGRSTSAGLFKYGGKCNSVAFSIHTLQGPNGNPVDYLKLPTSAAIWQDGKLYIGTISGSIHALGYDPETFRITSHCYSKPILDSNYRKPDGTPSVRSVLGIAFDPRDKVLRVYTSTSTIYSLSQGRIDSKDKSWWHNGAIERLKPGSDTSDEKVCLVYDKRIVSNLPVSNHDHAVNSIVFTQSGDLLISVGGNTNSGLPSFKFGGMWDTVLSGAILIAKLSSPTFNGNIQYNSQSHFLAGKVDGDVSIFARGTRNAYGMIMTSNGDVYAVDQGSNCDFGDVSASCSDFNLAVAKSWNISASINWPGRVAPKAGGCKKSAIRPDKVLHITKGSFYGHPNMRRKRAECAWIDPYSDSTADGKKAPKRYKKAMALLKSSVTGIVEYRAQHFCSQLRGELILTSYKGAATYRMGVDGSSKTKGPEFMIATGGTAIVENQHGVLFPLSLSENRVLVLKPTVTAGKGLYISGLSPLRHGAKGGTVLTVGGGGFEEGMNIKIGGDACMIKTISGREVQCIVPPHQGGLKDLVVMLNGKSARLRKSVLYMNV